MKNNIAYKHNYQLGELLSGSTPLLNERQTKDLRYIIDTLPLQSHISRMWLYSRRLAFKEKDINEELGRVEVMIELLRKSPEMIEEICHLLSQFRDIMRTINNLLNVQDLEETEFFEIKHLALLWEQVHEKMKEIPLWDWPDLSEAIQILDPDGSGLSTFHLYSVYDERLAELRKKIKETSKDIAAPLYDKLAEVERSVRHRLKLKLRPHSQNLWDAHHKLIRLDVLIAKAKQALQEGFCKPQFGGAETVYEGLFNPLVRSDLAREGKEIQPIDVSFEYFPTLLTGMNMGGKTVLLRTLGLCQMLAQFAFYLPAKRANVQVKEGVFLSMEDGRTHQTGLSSFAAEMETITRILKEAKENYNLLVLIDEPARTTNPHEGRAIVAALVGLLARRGVSSFVTTHYDDIQACCRRLRVKGIRAESVVGGKLDLSRCIDYSLVEDYSNNAPREAIVIAQMLGADEELIQKTQRILEQEALRKEQEIKKKMKK